MGKEYRASIVEVGNPLGHKHMDSAQPFMYSHAQVLMADSRTRLDSVSDFVPEEARLAGEKLEVGYFTDWRQMVRERSPEIVSVGGKGEASYEVLSELLLDGSGVKGVYVEQPLARRLEDLDRLESLEDSSSTKVQVNYLRANDTSHKAIVDYIRGGNLGAFQSVHATYNGGVISVLPQLTALLDQLFDGVSGVSGIYSPIRNTVSDTDPNVDGTVHYKFSPQSRDVAVQFTATGRGKEFDNNYLWEQTFRGSKGQIRIRENGWTIEFSEMRPSGIFPEAGITHSYSTDQIPAALKADAPREMMAGGLSDLIEAIENGGDTRCGVRSAKRALEISFALKHSAELNGRFVEIPLENRDSHYVEKAGADSDTLRKETGADKK